MARRRELIGRGKHSQKLVMRLLGTTTRTPPTYCSKVIEEARPPTFEPPMLAAQ